MQQRQLEDSSRSLAGSSLVDSKELSNAVFQQLLCWFQQDSHKFQEYKSVGLVGPRREGLTSHVYLQRGTNRKTVLKSFVDLDDSQTQQQIVWDVMVPLIVDHPRLLSSRGVFMHEQVRLISDCTSSTTTKRAATYAIYSAT